MTYTEVRTVGKARKYYRVYTYRHGGRILHRRKYLGADVDQQTLHRRERVADVLLSGTLEKLLTTADHELLERIRKRHQAKPRSTRENRYESFIAEFTYDSTGIEGNTLTLRETAAVLFEGTTPYGKSLRELHEVLNHKRAFDYLLQYKGDVNKKFLCELQRLVTENTLRPEVAYLAGKYRDVQVFIRGAKVVPPPPVQVSREMRSLIAQYHKRGRTHPVVLAAYLHTAFEAIHPFVDGNGRAGRLLLNFILHKHGYPMVSIPRKMRLRYFTLLAKAQQGNLQPFLRFIITLLQNSEKSI